MRREGEAEERRKLEERERQAELAQKRRADEAMAARRTPAAHHVKVVKALPDIQRRGNSAQNVRGGGEGGGATGEEEDLPLVYNTI